MQVDTNQRTSAPPRWPFTGTAPHRIWLLIALLLPFLALDCSKSRADDFSRFRPMESLVATGAAPRTDLRYRPVAGEDTVYQLSAHRRCLELGVRARMRLGVALRVSTRPEGGGRFMLRLISVERMTPPPPGGIPELGPAYVLLQGALGPRGGLADLQDGDKVPSPINLSLAMPLLLPRLPHKPVGVGARWESATRLRWSRSQAADSLVSQPGVHSSVEVLLKGSYSLRSRTAAGRPVVDANLTYRLRSRTRALSHATHHQGEGKATGRYELDPVSGLVTSARVSLKGEYGLRANDKTRRITETVDLTFAQK